MEGDEDGSVEDEDWGCGCDGGCDSRLCFVRVFHALADMQVRQLGLIG